MSLRTAYAKGFKPKIQYMLLCLQSVLSIRLEVEYGNTVKLDGLPAAFFQA